jgi:hypothetical protein
VLDYNICQITSSCEVFVHAGWDRARSKELHKRFQSHHGRENDFSEHADIMVANACAILEFIRRLSLEFRELYILKTLCTSLVRPKLEYANCMWNPFYGVRADRVEREQGWFFRYALRGLVSTDMHDLPLNEDSCAILHHKLIFVTRLSRFFLILDLSPLTTNE